MSTVKSFDSEDRPQERAEKLGVQHLALADLWALVLRSGQPGKPITELTRELMRSNDGRLHTLERKTRSELMKFKGLGKVKVLQIEAVMELIRRYNLEQANEAPVIRTSADIDALMRPRIANLSHEEIWVLFLNRRNMVLQVERISTGGTASTVFDVKLVIKKALLANAESMVMCHNHPSGSLTPSGNDDGITRQCSESCKTLSIRLLDHLILSDSGYYSYADHGRI